jgi:hypothetical protein
MVKVPDGVTGGPPDSALHPVSNKADPKAAMDNPVRNRLRRRRAMTRLRSFKSKRNAKEYKGKLPILCGRSAAVKPFPEVETDICISPVCVSDAGLNVAFE